MLGEAARAAGYRLIVRDVVASTMEEARRALDQGEPGRLWIVARSQNAGRGRHGRQWGSPPGNLYASLLLTDPCEPALAPQLGFVAGLALHDAVARLLGPAAATLRLKWPNDLLLGGAKMSGLLLEGGSRAGRLNVILGCGVNIASCPSDTPYPATYLKALAAHDNGVPFYVALPSPTIDWRLADGLADIPIEERAGREVSHVAGLAEDGEIRTVQVAAPGSAVANPAFDVTPARLVTGLITERGVCAASSEGLAGLFPDLAQG